MRSRPSSRNYGSMLQMDVKIRFRILWGAVLFILVMGIFTIPWMQWGARKEHIGEDYADVKDQDSQTLFNLRSFRDIPWEVFTHVHDGMRDNEGFYWGFSAAVWMTNAFFWYFWLPRRVFVDFQVTLLASMAILEFAAFFINFVTWFPTPHGIVQHESLPITFFLSLVTMDGAGLVSMRTCLTVMLWYDFCLFHWYDRPLSRKIATSVFFFLLSFYMLSTRQMYTFCMMVNLVTCYAAYKGGRSLLGKAELSTQKRTGVIKEHQAARAARQNKNGISHFVIEGSDEDEFDPDDEASRRVLGLDSDEYEDSVMSGSQSIALQRQAATDNEGDNL